MGVELLILVVYFRVLFGKMKAGPQIAPVEAPARMPVGAA